MALKKINYNGQSKIILRLCEMVNQLIDGGGGGGSTVAYTQTLQSGTKTGEISIDGVSTDMYAPTQPTKLSDLTNDEGFIDNTVNNLTNYYLKSETYTQAEVDALISAIVTLNILVVQTLPTQDISTTTIYLVPKQTAETQDIYDEYIYVNNAWELIGTTQIDLSNYYTKTEVNNLLSAKVSDNPTFTEASTRANIASGESFSTILGKIKKFFTDLKAVAFSGSYNDLTDQPSIPTDFVSKSSGGTFEGNVVVDAKNGTASRVGDTYLGIGNDTPSGTAGNSRGILRIYSDTGFSGLFLDNNHILTGTRFYQIPNKTGTLALTSDLTALFKTDTVTGNIGSSGILDIVIPSSRVVISAISSINGDLPILTNTSLGHKFRCIANSGSNNIMWRTNTNDVTIRYWYI